MTSAVRLSRPFESPVEPALFDDCPITFRGAGCLRAHSFELQPITLRPGDGLESMTLRLTRSLLTFSLRPRCGLETLTLRLESLPLRLRSALFPLFDAAHHVPTHLHR